MKSTTIILTLLAAAMFIGGAIAEPMNTSEKAAFVEFDKAPEPVNGFQSIFEKVKYPESAKKDNIEGIVFVSVFIDVDGSVSSLEIAEGVRKDLDQAAMEAIKQTKWLPAQKDNLPVACKISIPIQFKLKAKK
ncbi:energy transducer TonB [bacterium]|nr:energy transducer TonB [bacterium]